MSLLQPLRRSTICDSCRFKLLVSPPQRRWITRNHIIRIKNAEEAWKERAQEIANGDKQSMLQFLEDRGYVHQIVGVRENLEKLLTSRRVGVYCGVDPTAPSLHVGHLLPFMVLGWLYVHGYPSTFLLGGMTAKIGDPTHRENARSQKTKAEQKVAMVNMHLQLKKFGRMVETYASRKGYKREWSWRRAVLNNSEWMNRLSVGEFMRVLASGIRLGPLLGRDTVKTRLGGSGMSFAELAYPLLQAWDWWHLYKSGVQIQVGGADQFGNILAGIDAIKAMRKVEIIDLDEPSTPQVWKKARAEPKTQEAETLNEPIGFTVPLLTSSSGVKFGKSEGNAIWLDKEMTSVFELYQFFVRTADVDVDRYLKLFTFLTMPEIEELMQKHSEDASKQVAQHQLAFEVVELIYGLEEAEKVSREHKELLNPTVSLSSLRAQPASDKIPGDWSNSLNKYAKPASLEKAPSLHVTLPRSLVVGQSMNKVLWSAGLVSSRSEGYRLIANHGAQVGSRMGGEGGVQDMGDSISYMQIKSADPSETERFILEGDILVLKVGKWRMKIIKIVPDAEFESMGLSCPGWKDGDQLGEDYKEVQRKRADYIAERKRKSSIEGKVTRPGVMGLRSYSSA